MIQALAQPKRLKPILDRKDYSLDLEIQIREFWFDLLYRPLLKILGVSTEIQNKRLSIPIDELLPNPHNRAIERPKVEAIKKDILATKSIKPFVVAEVLTDSGPRMMITDGHHRLIAVSELIREGKLTAGQKVPAVTSGDAGIRSADGVAKKKIMNSKAGLIAALKAGRVQYQDGFFVGEFNANVSRDLRSLGAKKFEKGFKISLSELPQDVRGAVADSANRMNRIKKELEQYLNEVDKKIEEQKKFGFSFMPGLDRVFLSLDEQFKKSTADFITIDPEMTEGIARRLSEDYFDSVDYEITGWSQKKTASLRAKLEPMIFGGVRADTLAKTIQFEAGSAARRARFIARQETSLLVSKYREERYKEVGLNEYEWSTSNDERVRKSHKELNGKIFSWDKPPITNSDTGEQNNPGEDYNCRCVAIPILR